MKFELTRDYAQRMDTEDILAKYKDRFYKLKDTIYMDGNSLGLMSKDAEESLNAAIEAWKNGGIDIWGKYDYFLYQDRLGAMLTQ